MISHRKQSNPRKRSGNVFTSPYVMLFLLLIVFFAGAWLGGRWSHSEKDIATEDSINRLLPVTATPLPSTPVMPATPTPTSPQLDGVTLTTLYIDIEPDDFARLEAKRAEALETWVLLSDDTDYIPATVRWGDEAAIPVELRLKGDWGDHFSGDKWSFRIRTRGGNYIQGMEVFSVQDPGTRAYLNEWLFLMNLRQENVLGVRYDFVRVVQNGQFKGVYAMEEGFATELIESQGRREGVLLRYNEDLLWEYWEHYDNDLMMPAGLEDFRIIDEFQTGRVLENAKLLEQRNVAAGKLRAWRAGERAFSEVFDVDSMARFLALNDLWGAKHALRWHNLRFYYNPVTTLLEPVGFDNQPDADSYITLDDLQGLYAVRSYEDTTLQSAYVRYLWEYSQPEYLETLRANLSPRLDLFIAELEPELGDVTVARLRTENDNPLQAAGSDVAYVNVLTLPWDSLEKRQASLREMLTPLQMIYATVPLTTGQASTVTLEVGNLLPFPVEILGLSVGETWYPASSFVATDEPSARIIAPQPMDASFMTYQPFGLPIGMGDIGTQSLSITTRLWGLSHTYTQPVLLNSPPLMLTGPLPLPPSLDEVLAKHPYIKEALEPQLLEVIQGNWDITDDLVLPEGYGLRITAGTQMNFGEDNFILARGPLYIDGVEGSPVTLQAKDTTWQGIVVLNAGKPSLWHYATIRDTIAPVRPGWGITGGVTFYKSPLRLDHCGFIGTRAEDALNLFQTEFEFVDVEFANTASDAFDADFCQGSITRSYFHDIGADGVDVSGSDIVVESLRMERLGDKGLSVGENSRLQGSDLWINDADFGVVSKDLSQINVTDVSLGEVRIAGFAAYIKKPAYGPATLTANDVTFVDEDIPEDRLALVQIGCWVDLNGVRIWGVALDIESLYEKWRR